MCLSVFDSHFRPDKWNAKRNDKSFYFFVETKTDLKISVKGENTVRLILV